MKRLVVALLVFALAGMAPAAARAGLHDDYDAILRAHVAAGRVDYEGIAGSDLPRLEAYLDRLASVRADSLAPSERLAYWLNLYNATLVHTAATRIHTAWRPDADRFGTFRAPLVRTKAGVISLDSLERGIIRPRAREPRVHMALCCGALSCPPLQPRAYRGADLGARLDANVRAFLADSSQNRFDPGRRTAKLSKLFEWYAADFGGRAGVVAFVRRYAGVDIRGWTITYAEYDWALNVPAGARR